jgi:hypothetical protein
VTVCLILSVLFGAILGRFCKVLALLLACAFILFIFIVRFAYGEHSLLRSLFEFAVLTTSLQIAYFLGLFSDGRVGRRDGTSGQVPPIYSEPRGLRKSRSL